MKTNFSERLMQLTVDAENFIRETVRNAGGNFIIASEQMIEEGNDDYFDLPSITLHGKHYLWWDLRIHSISLKDSFVEITGADVESGNIEEVSMEEMIDRDIIYLAEYLNTNATKKSEFTEQPQHIAELSS